MNVSVRTLFVPALMALAACGSTREATQEKATEAQPTKVKPATGATKTGTEPDYITVDHILIAFNGAPRMQGVTRSLDEAEELTDTIVAKLNNDGDWLALKKQFSDDPGPTGDGGGPYSMSNTGAAERPGIHPRSGMVPAFGNVGFKLDVGEIGVAEYDSRKSPYGYHIIKRVK